MNCQIRAMMPVDIAAARQLWASAEGVELAEGDAPGEIARYLARNPGVSTVAADPSGQLVGAVLCGHDGRRGFVYHLAVAPTHRRRGLAREMMQRSLAALKGEGIVRVLLLVASDNSTGHEFWRRDGWEDMPFAQPMGIDL